MYFLIHHGMFLQYLQFFTCKNIALKETVDFDYFSIIVNADIHICYCLKFSENIFYE